MVNSVFTLYELSNGDDTEGEGTVSFFRDMLGLMSSDTVFRVLTTHFIAFGLVISLQICLFSVFFHL